MQEEAKSPRLLVILLVSVYVVATFAMFARLLYVSMIARFDLNVFNTALMLLLLLGALSAAIWLAQYAKSSENDGFRCYMGAAAAFLAAPILLLELAVLYFLVLSALGIEWFPVPGSEGSEAALSSAIPQRFTDLLMIERFVK